MSFEDNDSCRWKRNQKLFCDNKKKSAIVVKPMELFFFILTILVVLVAFLSTRQNPNAFANFIIGLVLMGIAVNIYVDGLSIPNTGVSYSGSTATFTSTNYDFSNAWVMGIAVIFLPLGLIVFGWTLSLLASGRVMNDGSIR